MSDTQQAREVLKRWVDGLPSGHVIPDGVVQAVRELTLGGTLDETGWKKEYALQGAVDQDGDTVVMLSPLPNGEVQALYEGRHVLSYPPSSLRPTGVDFVVVRADTARNALSEMPTTPRVMVDVRNRVREMRDSASQYSKRSRATYGKSSVAYMVHERYREALGALLEETDKGQTLETVEELSAAPAGTIVAHWGNTVDLPDVAVKGHEGGWWRDGLTAYQRNSEMLEGPNPVWHVMRWGDKR